jgi:hypothetical protein
VVYGVLNWFSMWFMVFQVVCDFSSDYLIGFKCGAEWLVNLWFEVSQMISSPGILWYF